jgi:hypothetical protein
LFRVWGLLIFVLGLNACTGSLTDPPDGAGSIKITPGQNIQVDLQDVFKLGVTEFTVTLRTLSPDYSTQTAFFDITPLAIQSLSSGSQQFTLVLPKSIQQPRPYLVVVELPEIQEYVVDALFDRDTYLRPGLAAKLAYDLLDSYDIPANRRPLASYTRTQFRSIQAIIQQKIDLISSQSEILSPNTVNFARLMRFYKNSMAFNPTILNRFKENSVNFAYDTGLLQGASLADIPENQTADDCFRGYCYKHAMNFRVVTPEGNEVPAIDQPFKHNTNAPAQLQLGATNPQPDSNLSVEEKTAQIGEDPVINVRMEGYDLDDDYMEKVARVKFTPRVLPAERTSAAGFPFKPEKTPEEGWWGGASSYRGRLAIGPSGTGDSYQLDAIETDEALNPGDQLDANGNPLCSPNECRTAFREINYLISDGMAWMPYRWKFAYTDRNRKPQFLLNTSNGINSTLYDQAINAIFNEAEIPGTNGWRPHASTCESDPNDSRKYIKSRVDSPWSCAFVMYDPDLDEDPNGAPDQFFVSAYKETDILLVINFGARLFDGLFNSQVAPLRMVWPPTGTATVDNPGRFPVQRLIDDCPGHRRCGVGLVQIPIDNAVKVAAESQSDQTVSFDIKIFDRPIAGQFSKRSISRRAEFMPQPPFLINFGSASPTPIPGNIAVPPLSTDLVLANGSREFLRSETYLDEISGGAKPSPTANPNDPYGRFGFPVQLLDATRLANRTVTDLSGVNHVMSGVIHQPFSHCLTVTDQDNNQFFVDLNGNVPNAPGIPGASRNGENCRGLFAPQYTTDPLTGMIRLTNFTGATPVLLGNSLRSMTRTRFNTDNTGESLVFDRYSFPRENDLRCSAMNFDPLGLTWDQRAPSSDYLSFSTPTPPPAGSPTPSPTPLARTPQDMPGVVFEINAVDFDNLDLLPREPSDPIYITLDHDLAASTRISFCHPPTPNIDSRIGETYRATNPAGDNGIDPDACTQWSSSPPTKMQPVPVFYRGLDENNLSVPKKLVYHRLRVMWNPADQGHEKKLAGALDPPGVVRNVLKGLRLHGNLYQNQSPPKSTDKTELATLDANLIRRRAPIQLFAQKQNFAPCLSGVQNQDVNLHQENQDSGKIQFSVADSDRVNELGTSWDGAVSGVYEVDFSLLGNDQSNGAQGFTKTYPLNAGPVGIRNLFDPEVVKWVPHIVDCGAIESRPNLSASQVRYRFASQPGTNYRVRYTTTPVFGTPVPEVIVPVSTSNDPEQTVTLTQLPPFSTVNLSVDEMISGNWTPIITGDRLQANPSPTPISNAPAAEGVAPAIWYSSDAAGNFPRIRFRTPFNQGSQMCMKTLLNPTQDVGQIPFVGVWRISRTNPADVARYTLDVNTLPWLRTCTGRDQIILDSPIGNGAVPQQHLLVGVKDVVHGSGAGAFACAPNLATVNNLGTFTQTPQVLLSGGGIEISLIYKIDYSSPIFGNLAKATPSPSPMNLAMFRLDWFPQIYERSFPPIVTKVSGTDVFLVDDRSSLSALHFQVDPVDLFSLNTNPASPTFGLKRYVGFGPTDRVQWINTHNPASTLLSGRPLNLNVAPRIPILPNARREHDFSIRAVDFDGQLQSIQLVSPAGGDSKCLNSSQYCVRRIDDRSLELITWAPTPGPTATPSLSTFVFRTSDHISGGMELDPYDVHTYLITTPTPIPNQANPVPIQNPSLSGLAGRANCITGPANYPNQSTLDMDLLDPYKKCTWNWVTHANDAGNTYNFEILAQDNLGANPSATPILMGTGGRHPISMADAYIDFTWNNNPMAVTDGVNPATFTRVPNSTSRVFYTLDTADTGSNCRTSFTLDSARVYLDFMVRNDGLANCVAAGRPANDFNSPGFNPAQAISPTNFPPCLCHSNRFWAEVPSQQCHQSIRFCRFNASDQNKYRTHEFRVQHRVTSSLGGGAFDYVQNPRYQPPNPYVRLAATQVLGTADSFPLTNSPPNPFKVKMIALERNNAPYFLGANQAQLPASLRYTGASGTAWDAVFPSTNGVFPTNTCLPTSTQNFDCTNSRLTLNSPGNHFLASSTPRDLEEKPLGGPIELFEYVAEDVANTLNLRKLKATAPTRVLVLGPPGSDIRYSTYSAPSFSQGLVSFATSSDPNAPANTSRLRISFKWAPTDEEAFFLSNSEGFLIPIVVEDEKEDPSNNDPSFSQNFVSQKMQTTLWIWCRLKVLNQPPMVYYRALDANKNPTGPKNALAGATLQFQTGSNNRGYVILVEDKDVARFFRSSSNSSERTSRTFYPIPDFFPSTPLIQASASPNPPGGTFLDSNAAPTVVIQQFFLNAAPTSNEIGVFPMSIQVSDPGDPARGPGGLTVTPHPTESNRAGLPGSQNQTISFNMRVVGKPTFLAPAQEVGNQYTELYSASLFGLSYPISLNLTRPEERSDLNSNKNFFMGIVVKSSPIPTPSPNLPLASALTGINSNGFAINENYLLTLGPNTFGDPAVDTSRLIMIGAVADRIAGPSGTLVSSDYCSSNRDTIDTSSATAVTLRRLRSSDGKVEFCNLSATNATNNLALVTVRHTVVQSRTTVPSIQAASLVRETQHQGLGTSIANEEYRDFLSRCSYCSEAKVDNGIAFSGSEITGFLAGTVSTSTHTVTSGTDQGKQAQFIIDDGNSRIRREIQDSTPTGTGFMEGRVQKGETLKLKADLGPISGGGQGLVARWYINGCLKSTQAITTQSVEYQTTIGDTASGLNNDCSGQFERTETSPALSTLGYYKVTLRIANGSELLNSVPGSSDGSPVGYEYILRVVNTNPAPMLAGSDLRANPIGGLIASSSTYPVKNLMGFVHLGRPMYAYVEQQSSSGSALRVRAFTDQGTTRSDTSINLSCNTLAGEVSWMGINTVGSSLQVALASGSGMFGVGLNTAYPVSALQSVYQSQSHTCYHGNLSGATASGNNVAGSNAVQAAAQTLAFAANRQSSRITAMLSNGAGGGHLIDQGVASSEFWNVDYPMVGNSQFNTAIFATLPSQLTSYSNNAILKNLVQGQKLIQLIGADPGKSAVNIRGFITVSGLSTDGRRLNASVEGFVDFPDCDGFIQSDRDKNPTPLDAVYHLGSDTLFIMATDTSADPIGYLAEVRGLLNGSRTCRVISKASVGPSRLEAPSRFMTVHNTSVNKLALDSAGGILYGVISKGVGMPGQVFSYDFVTRKAPRSQTLSFPPTAILFTPSINAVHVLDGTYQANPLITPTLYRIW